MTGPEPIHEPTGRIPAMKLSPGARLGPYVIVEPLGSGAMGEVYRCRDERLGRDVAVKLLAAALWARG